VLTYASLHRREYLALLGSLLLIFLEVPVRIITLLLRKRPPFSFHCFLAHRGQHNPSSASATIDPRTSSIAFRLQSQFEPDPNGAPSPIPLPMLPTLLKSVRYLAIMLKSMLYRLPMATCLAYIGYHTGRAKSKRVYSSMLAQNRLRSRSSTSTMACS
jgi:hypothetical protein